MSQDTQWEFVELKDYKKPNLLLDELIRSNLSIFMQRVKFRKKSENEFQPSDQLIPLSKTQINRLLPQPDWHQAINNLNLITEKWRSEKDAGSIIILLNIPGSRTDEIVNKWASTHSLSILAEPDWDTILSDEDKWVKDKELSSHNVITNLENYFVKHINGFKLLCTLFEHLIQVKSNTIICCNSWSWNFLIETHILENYPTMPIFIPQAFNADNLKSWFVSLTKRYISRSKNFAFRRTSDGTYVLLPKIFHSKATETKTILDYKIFTYLNSYTFGLPTVALELWKNSMRKTPDDEFLNKMEEENKDDTVESDVSSEEFEIEKDLATLATIWVLPWEKYSLPTIFAKLDTTDEIILHALIGKNNMSVVQLKIWLGNTKPHPVNSLRKLVRQGLITEFTGNYSINPIAYPAIAKTLSTEGYLTDGLV